MLDITVFDQDSDTCAALQKEFEGVGNVQVANTDLAAIIESGHDIIACPGNSFGLFVGEGDELSQIERQLTVRFPSLVTQLRDEIRVHWGGECPVGSAVSTYTGTEKPYRVIYAPVFRAPGQMLEDSAYLATRATLLSLGPTVAIEEPRVALPSFGTNVPGGLDPEQAAIEMRAAWNSLLKGTYQPPRQWEQAYALDEFARGRAKTPA